MNGVILWCGKSRFEERSHLVRVDSGKLSSGKKEEYSVQLNNETY